jgi:RNA 3'-terminal phosphate cyclase (ATP)
MFSQVSSETDAPSVGSLVVIDGSKGEGGGQILRNAISFSNILRKQTRIFNIRAKRSKPGLKAQHLAGLRLATQICGGKLSGDELDSTEIMYSPAPPSIDSQESSVRTLNGEIDTAGSICLLLQAALPCALLGHSKPLDLILKGGTNASMAPQYDYWEHVFLPTLLDQCKIDESHIQAKVIRRGYFPKGGGEVHVHVEPLSRPLQPIQLIARGDVTSIYVRSFHAGNIPRKVAVEMAKSASTYLKKMINKCAYPFPARKEADNVPIKVEVITEQNAIGSGCGILCVATTYSGCRLAGSALGSPKKKAEEVGQEAAQELIQTLLDGGCVDEWLQDQMILYMALAEGESEMMTGTLTMHTKTAIWIAEKMTGTKFVVEKIEEVISPTRSAEPGKSGRTLGTHYIQCTGIGFHSK